MLAALTVGGIFQWILDNWSSILASAAMIVAASSALIKALEVLVAILVKLFPGLKTVDGDLKGAADWLDSLAKSGFLTKASLSPKPADATAPVPAALKAAGFAQVRVLALVAALTGVALLAPSCATMKLWGKQSLDCGQTFVTQVPDLMPKIEGCIITDQYVPCLESLLVAAGPVVVCSVAALVQDLERGVAQQGLGGGPGAAASPGVPAVVQLIHANHWLALQASK